MSGAPEFSRRVKLARIGAEPYRQQISATDDERAALARRFDLVSLDRLDAAVELIPIPGANGRFCCAPISRPPSSNAASSRSTRSPGVLAERFELLYGPPEAEETASSLVGDETSRSSRSSATRSISARRSRRNSRWRCRPSRAAPKSALETDRCRPRRVRSVCRVVAACRSRRRRDVSASPSRLRRQTPDLPGARHRCCRNRRNLAKYRNPSPLRSVPDLRRSDTKRAARDETIMAVPKKKTSPSRRNMRRSHHALQRAGLCRMPRLRRAEAAASPVPVLRPLRRARSRAAAGHDDSLATRLRQGAHGDAVNGSITIAVDAMGGDRAPAMVLQGRRYRPRARPRRAFSAVRRRSPHRAAAGEAAAARGAPRRVHHTARCRARRRQAVGGVARRTPVEHAAGDRRGRRRPRRLRRFRRQHRRADGDGQIRAEDAAGHRPPGDRRAVPDPARRKRDARSRRQCRMRRREPGAIRGDGQCLRPHRSGAAAADRRAAECRLGGHEGKRRGARRACPAARGDHADPLSRLCRGRRHRGGNRRCHS